MVGSRNHGIRHSVFQEGLSVLVEQVELDLDVLPIIAVVISPGNTQLLTRFADGSVVNLTAVHGGSVAITIVIIEDDRSGVAVLDNSAQVVIVAAVIVQVVNDVVQLIAASLIDLAPLVVVLLNQHNVHIGVHPQTVSVNGVDGLKVQLSKCCNPIPGDAIIGYVSKGQGIKVHRADCPNLKGVEKGRLIDVYWDYTNIMQKRFEVDIDIRGLDRPNLLNDIITVLGQVKVNILNINAGVVDTEAQIQLKLSVENAELLQTTIDNLNKIQGIYNITRVIH